MKYVLYFPHRKQIDVLPETYVMFTKVIKEDEWKRMGAEEVPVSAIMDDRVVPAYVIMAVPNDNDDCRSLLQKLEPAVNIKRLSQVALAEFCTTRWKPDKRLKMCPVEVRVY